jgi:hypothetical protein
MILVAVAVRAGRLTGWRRWTLLGVGAYQTTLILVPVLLGAAGPSWPAWQVCWVLVGVAAVRQPRAGDEPRPDR